MNRSLDKKICFVQLTRMGDLLQTYRVASSLKKHIPETKLHLVARRKFALPLKFLLEQCFDNIFLLDIKDMVESVTSRDDLIANVSKILEDINSNDFDELVNLSWSRSSEYLCSLIRADNKKGIVRNNKNQVMVEDRWSQMVYSMVMRGDYCPYNIVDIYRSITGSGSVDVKPKTLKIADRKKILIHPFASDSKKYWKYSKWAEVIYKVLKTDKEREVFIVGGEGDREQAEKILESPILDKYRGRICSKIDEMNVCDLLNELSCSELFVGHDSFVSHLAALTDIPIVTLAMGTVRVRETAPYSSNAYIISPKTSCYPCLPEDKCDFYKCHADIPYQVVVGVIDLVLKGKNIDALSVKEVATTFLMSSVDIFKTNFKESGFLHLDKITDSDIFLKDVLSTFYRMAYLCFFEMPEEKVNVPELSRGVVNELKEIMEGLENVYELYQFGKTYSKNVLEEISSDSPCVVKLKSYSDNIDEVERLQNLLSIRYPALKPMIDFFIVDRGNVKGNNAVEISEENFYSYHGSSIFASVMYELCEKTIGGHEGHTREKTI